MASSNFNIHSSPLFNKTMKGQLPPSKPAFHRQPHEIIPQDYRHQQISSYESKKSNEIPVHQPNILEGLYGSVRKPRTFKQWEDAARENTQRIKEQGSPSPLVWVLVKGKDIPVNAIVAGVERQQHLYIARTFYEGGICIGKAGRHLERGAAIPYNGLEIQIDTYEVLVPALQPLRYGISLTAQMPAIPRIVGDITIKNKGFERLNMIKTVILVDDSASMAGPLWADAREALAGITDLNAQVSNDGVDVYFMNDHRFSLNCKEGNEVKTLFNTVNPCGETPIGRKLEVLFDKYIPLIENKTHFHRPIAIVVITDGVPTDDLTTVIVNAARRLDRNNVPPKKFGVQFAQIGNDPEATEALQELDDDLSRTYNIRDMVDTTPYNPHNGFFTSETLVKILLGAVNEELDSVVSPTLTSPSIHEKPMLLF
ncbi:hypothetical protein BDZ94DRAFT_1274706 [Collybia nuda]|uniref:VWFA domain-containing protein n=1 Tax=Collybia nuda TaxID=64659 RepID=A0A9P5XSK9_9AGAR|nr:hypothetical protein BDZ94DRAFT_1274706 [Collybia nuda]